ncbi:MAG: hypothetical protein Q8J67_05845 [Rhodocyclaceae bacterium]|nr:hypothetical protein [Rhodocyclaceae bacterium]
MYAVAFDLVVAETEKHHPKGVTQAYTEIGAVLGEQGFRRVQGSLYVTEDEDMPTCSSPSRHCVPANGFQSRCATSAPSASNSGLISPAW